MKNKQKQSKGEQQKKHLVVANTTFSGPIPPPYILEEYRKIIPDAPERILKMAEKNSDHLIEIDKVKAQAETKQVMRGQIFALITIFLVLFLCAYALLCGYPYVAGILAGLDLIGLVIAFTFSRLEKNKYSDSR